MVNSLLEDKITEQRGSGKIGKTSKFDDFLIDANFDATATCGNHSDIKQFHSKVLMRIFDRCINVISCFQSGS